MTDALSRGELAYDKARADVDGVIAGLIVVLAQRGTPRDLPIWRRSSPAGSRRAKPSAHRSSPSSRQTPAPAILLVELRRRLCEAAGGGGSSRCTRLKTEQDRLLRQTIQTQLEATTWTPFADLTP